MPVSESQKKATRKWNESNLDRIYLVMRKGEKDKIKSSAERCGESINTYIKKAIEARMNNE